MCIPSPAILHLVLAVRDEHFRLPAFYADEDDFMESLAAAYRKAIRAFYEQGCRYLQLDDTSWGTLCSPEERSRLEQRGIDPDSLTRSYVVMINEAVRDRPADMAVTMHICRGNFRSTWMTSGGYEPLPLSCSERPGSAAFSWNTTQNGPGTSSLSALSAIIRSCSVLCRRKPGNWRAGRN